MNKENLYVGMKVTYVPDHGDPLKGIVKSLGTHGNAFVVYHCNDDYDNYADYTAASTDIEHLMEGWL